MPLDLVISFIPIQVIKSPLIKKKVSTDIGAVVRSNEKELLKNSTRSHVFIFGTLGKVIYECIQYPDHGKYSDTMKAINRVGILSHVHSKQFLSISGYGKYNPQWLWLQIVSFSVEIVCG